MNNIFIYIKIYNMFLYIQNIHVYIYVTENIHSLILCQRESCCLPSWLLCGPHISRGAKPQTCEAGGDKVRTDIPDDVVYREFLLKSSL